MSMKEKSLRRKMRIKKTISTCKMKVIMMINWKMRWEQVRTAVKKRTMQTEREREP